MNFTPTPTTGKEAQVATSFAIGDLVANYPLNDRSRSIGGRVVEILSDGSLYLRETGLNTRNAAEWIADPAKCEKVTR
jgi:hypothetical protein